MESPKSADRMEALTAQLLASARRYGADEHLPKVGKASGLGLISKHF